MWESKQFEPAIRYIRFPMFRNLSTNMRIDFKYPITALVGPNGSNKSAILRALQGSPRGNDLGRYWFGTAVDEISPLERHRFIYGRLSPSTGGMVEVVKTRIGRRRESRAGKIADPDLFEPSRPLTTWPDEMEKFSPPARVVEGDASSTRWSAIAKDVVYLDFRSQLSAFDWAFHQSEVATEGEGTPTEIQLLNARKHRIRNRAARLSRAVTDALGTDQWFRVERVVESVKDLADSERQWVSRILGKDYSRVRLIHHRYFNRNSGGWTVLLESKELRYSEAFAGSGEFAVVMLVYRLSTARPKSLVLIDEPEVSLHPTAQRMLSEYLVYSAKTHRHQIVFATHSSDMIRRLPAEAVKVLTVRADDGKVDIPIQDSLPQYAFNALGVEFEHAAVIVEDQLATKLVQYALVGSPDANAVDVKFIPGGADTLWTYYIPMWAHEGRGDILLLLDGDQEVAPPRPAANIPPAELETELTVSFKGNAPKLPYSSKEEGNSALHRQDSVVKTLEWRRRFVRFLPCLTPEIFLWPHRIADDPGPTATPDNCKQLWRDYAEAQTGELPDADSILTFQLQALNRVPTDDVVLERIREAVNEFIRSQP